MDGILGFASTIGKRAIGYKKSPLKEQLLEEREPLDEHVDGPGMPTLARVHNPMTPWFRYTFFLVLFSLYSFGLLSISYHSPSDSDCGRQLSVWCESHKREKAVLPEPRG